MLTDVQTPFPGTPLVPHQYMPVRPPFCLPVCPPAYLPTLPTWAATFIPIPMPKCRTCSDNKWVQHEVCRCLLGRGMGMKIPAHYLSAHGCECGVTAGRSPGNKGFSRF